MRSETRPPLRRCWWPGSDSAQWALARVPHTHWAAWTWQTPSSPSMEGGEMGTAMETKPCDSGPQSLRILSLSIPFAPRSQMGAQDKVKQTWALPHGSSWPAGEMMGTHLALVLSWGLSRLCLTCLLDLRFLMKLSSPTSRKEHTVGQKPGCSRHLGLPSQHPGYVSHRRHDVLGGGPA